MSAKPAKGNARSSGYDRNENDWYVEPAWSVEALLRAVTFEGVCWDPACGGGNIPRTLEAHGLVCLATDLVDRGFGHTPVDFLQSDNAVHNIITNPPFDISLEFAQHALKAATRKVAIIQRLAWLEGQKRGEFFRSTPLSRVLVFSRRVSMPPGGTDIPAKGGSTAYAWFVWDHRHTGEPRIEFLP